MPQGRRKVPFSGKAKKDQLKLKKQPKGQHNQPGTSRSNIILKNNSDDESSDSCRIQKINCQPNKDRRVNRYALQFHKETEEELKRQKELARHELNSLPASALEINIDDYFVPELDFPKRPPWSFNLSKVELESQENRYFTEYLKNLDEKFVLKEISYFELNLETWRQLWRVLEMSDIVLVILDIRFPALMFPPSLYQYVSDVLKKSIILILNKIDLAPTPLVVAWKHYFEALYPKLKVIMFTTLPAYNLMGVQQDKAGLQIRRRKGRVRMAAEGTKLLLDACKETVDGRVDLSSWEQKLKEESGDFQEDEKIVIEESIDLKKVDTSYFEHEPFKSNILTIGCIGQPNVGKSSLMNAIMGKKVVSVSRTPGHTKHFQTIFLTKNVRLCDCPGLVFPSKVPKVLQVLMGCYPIAQLRDPYSAIKYLAERLDLPKLLRIEHPERDETWSAMDICDGWAKKRGYLTAKAARLDSYRAANGLLRMALDGKITLCLRPPKYSESEEALLKHPDVELVRWVKAIANQEVQYSVSCAASEDDSTNCDESDQKESNKESEDEDSDELKAVQNKFSVLESSLN